MYLHFMFHDHIKKTNNKSMTPEYVRWWNVVESDVLYNAVVRRVRTADDGKPIWDHGLNWRLDHLESWRTKQTLLSQVIEKEYHRRLCDVTSVSELTETQRRVEETSEESYHDFGGRRRWRRWKCWSCEETSCSAVMKKKIEEPEQELKNQTPPLTNITHELH